VGASSPTDLTPFAGANRIRFDGCYLSLALPGTPVVEVYGTA
jgi:hypothetical protein